jgi:hypothetical protein
MYLQEILEVAVGLVFMWLVISLAAMQIQEWIANLMKMRATELKGAIGKMLTNPDLAAEFYTHPLIAGLSKNVKKPKEGEEGKKRSSPLPSYIPAGKFAAAIFDIVIKAGTDASPIQKAFDDIRAQFDSIDSPERKKLAEEDWKALLDLAKRVAVTQVGQQAVESVKIQAQRFVKDYPELDKQVVDSALGLVDTYYQQLLDEQSKAPSAAPDKETTLRQLRIGLLAMNSMYPGFKKTMGALLTGVEEYVTDKERALALARTNVESWFNDSMDRLSGWYKRRTQLIAFFIGLVLAIFLNLDSINLATTLWREPTLRQAIVAQADAYLEQYEATTTPDPNAADGAATRAPVDPAKAIAGLKESLAVLNIPFGWQLTPFDTGGKKCSLIPTSETQVFGFSGKDAAGMPACKYVSNFPADWSSGLSKFFGLLMTAAAAAQGAPFWFDILKKLINVRSTGPNPEEKKAAGR